METEAGLGPSMGTGMETGEGSGQGKGKDMGRGTKEEGGRMMRGRGVREGSRSGSDTSENHKS